MHLRWKHLGYYCNGSGDGFIHQTHLPTVLIDGKSWSKVYQPW